MKIPCDLILDLLPLYQNNLCSEASESIITEHLSTCENCYPVFDKMETVIDIPKVEVDADIEKVIRAVFMQQN